MLQDHHTVHACTHCSASATPCKRPSLLSNHDCSQHYLAVQHTPLCLHWQSTPVAISASWLLHVSGGLCSELLHHSGDILALQTVNICRTSANDSGSHDSEL